MSAKSNQTGSRRSALPPSDRRWPSRLFAGQLFAGRLFAGRLFAGRLFAGWVTCVLPAVLMSTLLMSTMGCQTTAGTSRFFPFGKSAAEQAQERLASATPEFMPDQSEVTLVAAQSDAGTPGPTPIASSGDSGVRGAGPTETQSLFARSKATADSITNFVTGKETVDPDNARSLYQQGDALFKQATSQTDKQRKASFTRAAKMFGRAGEAAPGSAIQQDALFMQAESLFFADRLNDAAEIYQTLQKEHERNRHNDRVAARLFSISRYWIDTEKSDEKSWVPINLTDASRPAVDIDGHAIRVLDQIRYDDPTGRLADDATMAAAAEYVRQEKYVEADQFLTDLRETFTDSEHLFLAHLLGIRTKLKMYSGPRYSNLVLEEAETLVKQTRVRFPDKMAETKYAEMVDRAAAEINFNKAERVAFRAAYREKRKEYGAAAFYYRRLLTDFADTPHAEKARERLSEIAELPKVPTSRLAWLANLFPSGSTTPPLRMKGHSLDAGGSGTTIAKAGDPTGNQQTGDRQSGDDAGVIRR